MLPAAVLSLHCCFTLLLLLPAYLPGVCVKLWPLQLTYSVRCPPDTATQTQSLLSAVWMHAIVGGVPARLLKWRFPPETSRRIIALAWWDWPRERLAAAVDDMRLLDAEGFLAKYEGPQGVQGA